MSKSASKKQKTKVVDWTALDKAENVNSFIDDIVDKPERFVDADSQIVESVLQNLKSLYDLSKELESQQMGPLKQLLIKGFDETQIWEEIQSQNRPLLKNLSENVNDICQQFKLEQSEFDLLTSAQLVKRKQDELKKINKQIEQKAKDMIASKKAQLRDADLDDSFDDLEDDDDENGENDDDLDGEDEEDGENGNDETEDKFFKLDDMEKFVQQAEDEEMMRDDDDDKDINDLLLGSEEDDEEGLDNLENGEEDEEEGEDDEGFEDEELDEEDMELERALEKRARGLKEFVDEEDDLDEDELNNIQMDNEMDEDEDMEDDENEEEVDEDDKEAADEGFWNAGKKKKNAVESDDEEMSKPKKKTEFQQKQAKAKEKIRSIEKDLIAEKPWTLIGEASAADRPQNSLLEATLDFEYATKLAPVITEEYTNGIEELIRKRIAEQLFDDVLRKLPTENKSFKPSVELDMEKSKLGLAEVYEQEYLEKVMGAEKTDKLAEEHGEIDRLFFTVCKKLDALANFHFTPKRFEPEVKIKTNVPAIRLEEAVPVSVSESTTLAPREVYAPENDSLKNDNELTQEERKKNRKHKKEVKRKKNAGIEAAEKLKKKLNPASEGNAKREREQALKMIKEQRNITIASKDAAVTGGSTSLFKKLQEETDKKVSTVRGEKPKEQKKGPSKSSTSFKM